MKEEEYAQWNPKYYLWQRVSLQVQVQAEEHQREGGGGGGGRGAEEKGTKTKAAKCRNEQVGFFLLHPK